MFDYLLSQIMLFYQVLANFDYFMGIYRAGEEAIGRITKHRQQY